MEQLYRVVRSFPIQNTTLYFNAVSSQAPRFVTVSQPFLMGYAILRHVGEVFYRLLLTFALPDCV